ncbi:putative mitochondrial protein atp12 precursor [Podospora australis]|uniref:Mitochondrial protein atp12 n=1 Tax=Podospora australis TaxID=1536484 RepID=A0AAN6WSB1_9PEZI|nr:putative mitochondrial protein atp12 precursor [Podospora australis]
MYPIPRHALSPYHRIAFESPSNMAPATRICLAATALPFRHLTRIQTCRRAIHAAASNPAKVAPVYGTGPPPPPPQPTEEDYNRQLYLAKRKRQAQLLREAGIVRSAGDAKSGSDSPGLKRRFWRDVTVKEVNGAYEIHLDTRPLRHPTDKTIIRLPLSKPVLAHALATEWDQLSSALDGTRQHMIPLTSLVCRALDIAADDAKNSSSATTEAAPIRQSIVTTVMRYMDTDSLLCWAPEVDQSDPNAVAGSLNDEGYSLRDMQEEAFRRVVAPLTANLWPGISIVPVLDGHSILPRSQEPGTREVVQGWVLGLSSWELAGLERATLAGKSLLAAARLVAEWSEEQQEERGGNAFSSEVAARAVSTEVDWQISRWGEVEDTHDVDRVDLRRQLGAAVLVVAGVRGE